MLYKHYTFYIFVTKTLLSTLIINKAIYTTVHATLVNCTPPLGYGRSRGRGVRYGIITWIRWIKGLNTVGRIR